MITYTTTETAKIIRKCLKESFNGVKFSVRKSGFSINISWTDGPNKAQVGYVVTRFESKVFDMMQDQTLYNKHTQNGEPVDVNVDYLLLDRDISQEHYNKRIALRSFPENFNYYDKCAEVRDIVSKLSFTKTAESKTAQSFVKFCALEDQRKKDEQQQIKEDAKRALVSIDKQQKRAKKYSNLQLNVKPNSVLVHWSESRSFEDGKVYSFCEFEQICENLVITKPTSSGYDKTKITVNFVGGDTYSCRLDLSMGCDWGFLDHIQQMLDYSQTEQGQSVYQREPELLDCISKFYTI